MTRQISTLIGEHPELKSHVYNLLNDCAMTSGLVLLAQAVAQAPDTEGFLLLIKIEIEHKRSFISYRQIRKVVTEQRPSEDWKDSYEIVPVYAFELRQRLLAMTTDGGLKDVPARYLNEIDKIRDKSGAPQSEPRHPDLA